MACQNSTSNSAIGVAPLPWFARTPDTQRNMFIPKTPEIRSVILDIGEGAERYIDKVQGTSHRSMYLASEDDNSIIFKTTDGTYSDTEVCNKNSSL